MFKSLLLRQIKSLTRFPYLEIMLLILVFETSGYATLHGIAYVANLSSNEVKPCIIGFANEILCQYVSHRIRVIYPIAVLFSSILSYLVISYFRDIGFLKTEFSFPVKRSYIYFSKFLASCLTLFTIIVSSVLLSIILNCFNVLQFLNPASILFGFLIILIEALLIAFFTSSITILLAFVVKWPGVALIVSASLLYSFEYISSNLRAIPIFPEALRIFEDRILVFSREGIYLSLNPYSLEPLIPSLIISILAFFSGYYYVTRRLQVS